MKNHHYNYQLSTTIWLSSTIITMTEISSLLLHHKLLSIWSGRWFADRNDRSLTFDPFSCAYGSKPLNVYGNWTCETWGTTIVFFLDMFRKNSQVIVVKNVVHISHMYAHSCSRKNPITHDMVLVITDAWDTSPKSLASKQGFNNQQLVGGLTTKKMELYQWRKEWSCLILSATMIYK